jgi:hypothetical protein
MASALSAMSDDIITVNSRGPMDFLTGVGDGILWLCGSGHHFATH